MKLILAILFLANFSLFGKQVLSELVFEIRNPQTGSEDFRNALEKIGQYLALDILEDLPKQEKRVVTLTGKEAVHQLVEETPVLVTILRAGLPLNAGVLKVFPDAEVGFFAMSRNEITLKATTSYIALPDLEDKYVILSDTMLATGGSMLDVIKVIEQYHPKQIYLVTAIASQKGVQRILDYDPTIKIFAAAIDPDLNDKGYIIPGLGDAGDRCYGEKHVKQE